jgi:hypothetical protein
MFSTIPENQKNPWGFHKDVITMLLEIMGMSQKEAQDLYATGANSVKAYIDEHPKVAYSEWLHELVYPHAGK